MALTPSAGNTAKVTLGATTVLGIGSWKMSGITVDLLETTAFGDTAKQFISGLVDYGTVSFGGVYDVSNAGGQSTLISAMLNNSKIPDLHLFINSVSAWVPDVTGLSAAGVIITSVNIGQDKSGLGTIEFTGKYTGPVVFE